MEFLTSFLLLITINLGVSEAFTCEEGWLQGLGDFIGGFQFEFVSISQVTNHLTCSSALISWKFILKNPLQDTMDPVSTGQCKITKSR